MYGSASLLSNSYYVLANQSENKKYSFETTPEDHNQLEAERIRFLKKALYYDEIYSRRVRTPEPKLYSAHIYQALGDYDRALAGFELMERYRADASNEISYLGAVANLGLVKLSKANESKFPRLLKEGMAHLRETHDRIQRYSSTPWYITIEKDFVRGLLLIGEKGYAQQLLKELHKSALRQKLFNQADSIRALSVKAA